MPSRAGAEAVGAAVVRVPCCCIGPFAYPHPHAHAPRVSRRGTWHEAGDRGVLEANGFKKSVEHGIHGSTDLSGYGPGMGEAKGI